MLLRVGRIERASSGSGVLKDDTVVDAIISPTHSVISIPMLWRGARIERAVSGLGTLEDAAVGEARTSPTHSVKSMPMLLCDVRIQRANSGSNEHGVIATAEARTFPTHSVIFILIDYMDVLHTSPWDKLLEETFLKALPKYLVGCASPWCG